VLKGKEKELLREETQQWVLQDRHKEKNQQVKEELIVQVRHPPSRALQVRPAPLL
jgi:hypothetical protein